MTKSLVLIEHLPVPMSSKDRISLSAWAKYAAGAGHEDGPFMAEYGLAMNNFTRALWVYLRERASRAHQPELIPCHIFMGQFFKWLLPDGGFVSLKVRLRSLLYTLFLSLLSRVSPG